MPEDERGIVIDWLLKMLVGLAIMGVILFDAGSIAVNHVGLDTTANDLAVDLSTEVMGSKVAANDPRLVARAKELARESGARFLKLTIDEEGVLRVRVARRADTLVVGRIEALEKWSRAVAGGQASTT